MHPDKGFVSTLRLLGVVGLMGLGAACGGAPAPESEPAPAAEPVAPPPAPPAASGPRVLFVQPQEGAQVKSPVRFEFGIENYQLSPVPAGTVETARPGMGHHHLGVDTDCLPDGQIIPPGTPSWVHFGKGDTTIEMQLSPGPHKFALQLGDDLHRTQPGLCATISITVAQ